MDIPIPERMRVNIWIDSDLYFAVKQKLLDHKIATRERLTITDILTKALQNYIEEGKVMSEYTEEHIRQHIGMNCWYIGNIAYNKMDVADDAELPALKETMEKWLAMAGECQTATWERLAEIAKLQRESWPIDATALTKTHHHFGLC